jgi:D-3-phosphoglycerate dehydrogenase
MVGQISTILADAKINIVDMLNKSREEVAYTLVDSVDKQKKDNILTKYQINCNTMLTICISS